MNRRFALIQALFSLVALAAVVWWATKQEPPEFPSDAGSFAWLGGAWCSTRSPRSCAASAGTGSSAPPACARARGDCYALTVVGYMGNNVLPARAGEALKVVLLVDRAATRASARCSGRSSPSGSSTCSRWPRSSSSWSTARSARACSRRDRPLLDRRRSACCCSARAGIALWVLRGHHVFDRVRDWLRPLADAPRALLGREGAPLLAATFVLWAVEAAVYLAVARAVELDFSAPARSTSWPSPTSSPRCPPPRARSARSMPPWPSAPRRLGAQRLDGRDLHAAAALRPLRPDHRRRAGDPRGALRRLGPPALGRRGSSEREA